MQVSYIYNFLWIIKVKTDGLCILCHLTITVVKTGASFWDYTVSLECYFQ